MIGLEVRLLAATHLPEYSYPSAFASVASMALDEAMISAGPVVLEPWIGLRLRVEDRALVLTLDTLAKFLGSVRADISLGDCFIVDTEIPARLKARVAATLDLAHMETRQLNESAKYRPLSGPLEPPTSQSALEDWT